MGNLAATKLPIGSVDRDPTKEALAAKAAALEAELATVKAELEEERARRVAAEQVALRLQRDYERLERQFLGPKSERVVDPNELPLPDPAPGAGADESDEQPEPKPPSEPDEKRRKRRRKGGRRKVADMDELRFEEVRSLASDLVCPVGVARRATASVRT